MNMILSQSRIPFVNNFPSVVLTALGTGAATLNLSVDAHFELWKVLISCSVDLDTDFSPSNVNLQITDQSTGRLLSNGQVPQRIYSPIGGQNRMPYPITFAPNSTLVLDLTDTSNATNTVVVSLWGYKLFDI